MPAVDAPSRESRCVVCGGAHGHAYDVDDFQILRCESCGLGSADPIPSRETLARFYADAYYAGEQETGYATDYEHLEIGLKKMYGAFLDRAERLRGRTGFDRVLDVGCAYGFFLDVIEQRYAPSHCVGVDVSPEAGERAAERGREFHAGFFEDVELPDAAFDLIFMGDAIEHVHDPSQVADKLVRVLAPGGVLLLTTVDFGSWLARWLGERWRLLCPPEHLYFWTRESLQRLFADRGLSAEVRNYWLHYPKSYVYQRTRSQFGVTPRFLALVPGDLIPIPSFDAMFGLFRKPEARP